MVVSLFTDPALQREALQIWNENRTGPFSIIVPVPLMAWKRVAQNITESFGDPASGFRSPHLEFVFGAVSIFFVCSFRENVINAGVKLSPAAYDIYVFLVSPASRKSSHQASHKPFTITKSMFQVEL